MKSIYTIIITYLIFTVLLTSCDEDVLDTTIIEEVSIQGYLHAGKPLENIKLTKVLTTEDESIQTISDAIISVMVDGQSFQLTSAGSGLYHYLDLQIASGKTYQITGYNYCRRDNVIQDSSCAYNGVPEI